MTTHTHILPLSLQLSSGRTYNKPQAGTGNCRTCAYTTKPNWITVMMMYLRYPAMVRVYEGKRCSCLKREPTDGTNQRTIYVKQRARCFTSTVFFIFVLHISARRSMSAWQNRLLVSFN